MEKVGRELKEVTSKLAGNLRKLQTQARNDSAVIEGSLVDLGKGEKVRLGDIAHVVGGLTIKGAKGAGRGIGVVVYENAVG